MTGRKVKEISVGDRFTNLVTIERVRLDGRNGYFWKCRCDCGTEKIVYSGHLKNGTTRGCGCLQGGSHNRTHGLSQSPEYKAWDNARSRCYSEKNRKYPRYGGRGISMCDEWRASFSSFIKDMGLKPSKKHTLERNDSNGNYEPSNCRWAIPIEQNRNRPSYNRYVRLNGVLITVSEASEITGLKHATIISRLSMGWSDEDALTRQLER